MKYDSRYNFGQILKSLPLRGAWIEIAIQWQLEGCYRSLPLRGRGLKLTVNTAQAKSLLSLPLRGAWIEINHQQENEAD